MFVRSLSDTQQLSYIDAVALAERLNTAHLRLRDLPRRPLGPVEVELLTSEWRNYRSSIGEPLHSWLGWTEYELERWQQMGELPEY